MTAPTLTSEQRARLWSSLGFGAPTPAEIEAKVAVMVADAAHEAEAQGYDRALSEARAFLLDQANLARDGAGAAIKRKALNKASHDLGLGTRDALQQMTQAAYVRGVGDGDRAIDALADLRGAVEALAGEWQGATCQTDGAPCSWHRVAGECAADLRALLNASSNP